MGGMFIRRPLVWVCTVCILLFAVYRYFYGEMDDKRYYIYEDVLGSEGVSVSVRGCADHLEEKTTSYYLYLTDVSLDSNLPGVASTHLSKLILSFSEAPEVSSGNFIQAKGNLCNFESATNPGQFDSRSYYREQGIYYIMYEEQFVILSHEINQYKTILFHLKDCLKNVIGSSLPEKQAGIVTTMLLGDKSILDPDIKQLYQQNGIGHLLAISGLHITILCMGLYHLLLWIRIPRKAAVPITLFLLYSYGVLTGFSISTNRAIIMMILYLLSGIVGRSYDLLSAMACSALILLIQKPFAITSSSFLLSYGAILGVGLVYPVLQGCIYGDEMERRKRRRKLHRLERERKAMGPIGVVWWWLITIRETFMQTLVMSIAIQISTLPVMLYFYYEIPTYGVILNLFVLPLASLLIILAALASLTGLCFLPVARFLFGMVYVILELYERLCTFFLQLPMPIILVGRPSPCRLVAYLFFALVAIWIGQHFRTKQIPLYLWAVGTLFLVFPVIHPALSITFLDVGQGDGIVLHTSDGTTFLIDGGSTSEKNVGEYRMKPFLKYYGIGTIDYMIMTHADEDHISGQMELLEKNGNVGEIQIKQLLLPEPSQEYQEEEGYRKMLSLASAAGVPVQSIHTGDSLWLQDLNILCLHPDMGFGSDSANAYSTSLSIAWQQYHFLLCGDLEGEGEDTVLERLKNGLESDGDTERLPVSYDVLKVSHHGSKNSTSEEFLAQVNPSLAVISCGRNNRYGHPHEELLNRLEEADATVMRTDQQGAVRIEVDSAGIRKMSYLP